jgi:hypothetical protein
MHCVKWGRREGGRALDSLTWAFLSLRGFRHLGVRCFVARDIDERGLRARGRSRGQNFEY